MTHGVRTTRVARRGLTMVEVIVCIAIIGGLMVAAMNTVGASVDLRERSVERVRGQMLADTMLAEVLHRQYNSPADTWVGGIGASSTERHADVWGVFDDVDDFHGWRSRPPVNGDGTAVDGFGNGWTRSVEVMFLDEDTLAAISQQGPGSSTRVKRVRVFVEHNGRVVATAVGMRTWGYDRYGGRE